MKQEIRLNPGESLVINSPKIDAAPSKQTLELQYGDTVTVKVPVAESTGELGPPPWEDVREQMPINANPDEPWLVEQGRKGWWKRTNEQIDGLTIHHTMSHNMTWMADYCTRAKAQGGKGYPTTNYAFWIHADGSSSYCVDITEAPWHDHCGDENTHISIGMAGDLSKAAPPTAQLEGLVKVIAYLMAMLNIPIENVEGHREWSARYKGKPMTVCPGWLSSGWRDQFYQMLRAEVDPASVSFSAPTPDYSAVEAVLAEHDEGR
jgi:hypothetical protein